MPKRRSLSPQSVWDQDAVRQAFTEEGVGNVELHLARLWGHMIRHPGDDWQHVAGLPEKAKRRLDVGFARFSTRLDAAQRSADGETVKLLLRLQDGLQIEAVMMRYDTQRAGGGGGVRSTLCVSSQVGCRMGCKFCATGTMGLKANLTAGEIVEQLAYALQFAPIRNVVFMGMGEPLDNYDAVKAALSMMVDPRLFALAPRHVTVSTVGVIHNITRLAHDFPKVSFALSLHAPTQELRQRIVPSAAAHKLGPLVAATLQYQHITGQKVFIEYVMLEGVNDDVAQAEALGALLEGHRVTVNLIPWNPVLSPDMHFGAPGIERVQAFQRVLRERFDMHCTIRQEKGQEISGACGQLVVDYKSGLAPKGVADIEEVASLLSKAVCA